MSKRKKIIVLSVMIGLLILTGYINVALNNSLSNTTNPTTTTQTSAVTESIYTTYKQNVKALVDKKFNFMKQL